MTGYFKGMWRVSGIYRQQWAQYGDPFATGTVALESKIGKSRREEGVSTFAVGGMMMYDKTPGGVIKSQYFEGLVAYHQVLDKNGYHTLGLGFMAGQTRKSLDVTHLTWGSQFTSYGFNTSLPSGEINTGKSMSNFDLQGGLLYTYNDNIRSFYLGTSMYHINSPKNYFYDNNTVQQELPKRWNLNAGGNVAVGDYYIAASAVYMRQLNDNYLLVGGSFGLPYSEEGAVYPGLWYRWGESFIPVINLQYKNMNIGLSYEAFLNGKTYVKPRSMEISIQWRALYQEPDKVSCYSF